MRVCARVCMSACTCACMRECVSVCVCMCVFVYVFFGVCGSIVLDPPLRSAFKCMHTDVWMSDSVHMCTHT